MLKQARTRRKLTQVDLAKKVRVHKITIQPSMPLLQRLAKALGVPVTELLG